MRQTYKPGQGGKGSHHQGVFGEGVISLAIKKWLCPRTGYPAKFTDPSSPHEKLSCFEVPMGVGF